MITKKFDYTKRLFNSSRKVISVDTEYYFNPSGSRSLEPALDGSDFNKSIDSRQNLNGEWVRNKYHDKGASFQSMKLLREAAIERNKAALADEKLFKELQKQAEENQQN